MITLTTGGPGTGKTAWLISQLLEVKKTQPYREFFIHGIRNFTGFKHTTIYCKSPLCDLCTSNEAPENALYVEDWHLWYKAHFLIVVDEVQRIWTTSTGQTKSEAISRLQTHRHYGLDFWLVSQSPKLIHADVKAMVGRHVHLVAKWAGRTEYEWPEIQENIQSRIGAVTRPYKLPKSVFSLYSSAEVHTKQEKRKPISFYVMLIAILFAVVMISFVVYRIKARVAPPPEVVVENTLDGSGKNTVNEKHKSGELQAIDMSTPEALIKAYTPIISGVPWSAPVYSELVKPVVFPVVAGCIQSKQVDKCTCYTQQATIVVMPVGICQELIQHKAFNNFLRDDNQNTEIKTASLVQTK
jgi:zona occludens toxin